MTTIRFDFGMVKLDADMLDTPTANAALKAVKAGTSVKVSIL